MPRLSRIAAATLTLSLLVAPAAQAAPVKYTVRTGGPAAVALDLLRTAWNMWTSTWAATTSDADGGTVDNAGARIDGNGGLVDLSGARIDGNGDAGARIDGNGNP